jgi:hypothetical protein
MIYEYVHTKYQMSSLVCALTVIIQPKVNTNFELPQIMLLCIFQKVYLQNLRI